MNRGVARILLTPDALAKRPGGFAFSTYTTSLDRLYTSTKSAGPGSETALSYEIEESFACGTSPHRQMAGFLVRKLMDSSRLHNPRGGRPRGPAGCRPTCLLVEQGPIDVYGGCGGQGNQPAYPFEIGVGVAHYGDRLPAKNRAARDHGKAARLSVRSRRLQSLEVTQHVSWSQEDLVCCQCRRRA